PCDYSRPTIKKHEGNRVEFNPGEEKNRAIYAIARETGTTLYMTLSALFTIFLHKISGSEDIITGTPTAGRRHGDLENVIGMFVNTLCMRNRPESRKTFREFLPEVKQGALDAFKNQEYPFEELVEKVAVNRDTGRNPIFDVLFVLQNAETNDVSIPGLTLSPYPYQHNTAKFDITLEVIEKKDKLHYIFEYSTELFKKETIERFIGYFKTIIASAIGDTGQKISGLEVLPAWEKQRLLIEFNDTENQYPHHKTLHRIFLDQVQKTPGRISVVGPLPTGKNEKLPQISYRQLNEKANRLAGILIQKGVTPGTIVALLVERSLEMIVAIYAILKTGAAYLPILPHHPAERTIFILED
ncbi:MAG: AMP-binding protein, partial [bacterium]|nr:AMP-binding protein [bacterium]